MRSDSLNFDDDERDIVGEPGGIRGPSDHFFHDRATHCGARFRCMVRDRGLEATVAEERAIPVRRFEDSVGVEEETVSALDPRRSARSSCDGTNPMSSPSLLNISNRPLCRTPVE